MAFLDFVAAFIKSVAKTTVNNREEFARRYEREHQNMDAATREKLNEFNHKTEKLADVTGTYIRSSSSSSSSSIGKKETIFGGKTVAQWDSQWISIGMLKTADLSQYNHCVGLYRHVVNGTTKYVGRAIELNNGGFRKRLNDYRRESNSARKHSSGQTIYQHLDEIETFILVIGNDLDAVEVTRKLEGQFVRKYNPEWNKQINI